MAIGLGGWIEELSELVLRLGREILLALEDDDLVFVKSPANNIEVHLGDILEIRVAEFCSKVDGGALGRCDLVDRDARLDGHVEGSSASQMMR